MKFCDWYPCVFVVAGNGTGGESIYGGTFPGKALWGFPHPSFLHSPVEELWGIPQLPPLCCRGVGRGLPSFLPSAAGELERIAQFPPLPCGRVCGRGGVGFPSFLLSSFLLQEGLKGFPRFLLSCRKVWSDSPASAAAELKGIPQLPPPSAVGELEA